MEFLHLTFAEPLTEQSNQLWISEAIVFFSFFLYTGWQLVYVVWQLNKRHDSRNVFRQGNSLKTHSQVSCLSWEEAIESQFTHPIAASRAVKKKKMAARLQKDGKLTSILIMAWNSVTKSGFAS